MAMKIKLRQLRSMNQLLKKYLILEFTSSFKKAVTVARLKVINTISTRHPSIQGI